MIVIVKKYSESRRFVPHFNRELGGYYHSSKDYVSDMKRRGLEPYKPGDKRIESKPYKRSDWGKAMLEDIKSRKGNRPGDRFLKELEKRGYSQKSANNARRIANGGCL